MKLWGDFWATNTMIKPVWEIISNKHGRLWDKTCGYQHHCGFNWVNIGILHDGPGDILGFFSQMKRTGPYFVVAGAWILDSNSKGIWIGWPVPWREYRTTLPWSGRSNSGRWTATHSRGAHRVRWVTQMGHVAGGQLLEIQLGKVGLELGHGQFDFFGGFFGGG